jgi:hypothetical protein
MGHGRSSSGLRSGPSSSAPSSHKQHCSWPSESQHGLEIRLKSPDGRIVAIIAGRSDPEGARTGVDRFVGDPAIAEAICAALTP